MTPRKPASRSRAAVRLRAAGATDPPPVAASPAAPPAPRPGPLGWPVHAALALTLVALFAHALSYRFLTDDAYISFRYAQNFAHGHGLVFNPGGERVEGYSNFLWVLILATFERVGVAPERAANPLSLLATAGLWWVVVRFAIQQRPAGAPAWLVVIPPAILAVSRSIAVWSTGGLETRLFELLATAGLMQVAEETDVARAGRDPGRPWGALLLGLAALTRPDGALVAVCALAASLGLFWMARRFALPELARAAIARGWPAVALIGSHYAFRFLYYGAWAPNTYYAKVGGRLRPEAGLEYLAAFALEYAAFLWVPLLVLAFANARRSPARTWIVVASAALVPHLLYVIAIGGDHFEYRPLDVLFPYIGLLLAQGAAAWTGTRARRLSLAAAVALILGGVIYLPWRSRIEFPRVYMPGFPGLQVSEGPLPDDEAADANRFLDPERSALTRLPLFREWGDAHRRILRRITSYYSGIRQEEHRHFFGVIHGEARAIRALIDDGLLPSDVSMAMDCVGAIPYVTRARTLDRLGLTDARVAHQSFSLDLVAHGKQASFQYAGERGMDLWFFHPAQLIVPTASSRAMRAFSEVPQNEPALYVAPLARDRWLMAGFPLGEAQARARMPRLRFWNMRDTADVRAALGVATAAWQARHDSLPRDSETLDALGFLHGQAGDWARAAQLYLQLAEVTPADPDPLLNRAGSLDRIGDTAGARVALHGAADRARAAGDAERLRAIEYEISRRSAASPPPQR
ncbi:MAG: hypothetical protein ABIS67_14855 [Candidatus Eisenbacteria bacterium]